MSTRLILRSLSRAALLGALAFCRVDAQASQGTVTGRVTDAASGQPIASAQVNLVNTSIGALTNDQGQYTIRGVSVGTYAVRALRVGFAEQRGTVRVSAGQSTTLDLAMKAVAVTLNPVVTTATGEQRRVEVGNSIAQVNAAQIVATKAVENMADLLTSRAPGVQVIPGTQIGAGSRIRIRGTSSLSLSNDPIYIIDGIRVEGTTGSSSLSVGGTNPSRINDINPEEIESIEVVRGPSAATLYGTSAANGVIVITTKQGVAGAARFTYTTEQGANVDQNTYPTAYRGWTRGATSSNTTQCFLSALSAGTCAQDSVTSFNLYADPETTPNGVGYRQLHSLQVGGGSELLRYFLHGEWENNDGVLKVPEFDQRYLAATGQSLLPSQRNPSHLDRIATRANFNVALSPKADIAVNAGYTSQDVRLPTSDDSGTDGVAGNTYGGPGFKYNTTTTDDTLYGYRQFTPRDVYQQTTEQGISRLITSATGNYRPLDWLSARGDFGLDYINRLDTQLCRFAQCPNNGDNRLGFKRDNRTNFYTYTANGSATATHQLTELLQSNSTIGVQFNRSIFDENFASGSQLSPGGTTVSQTAASTRSAGESTDETRTLGAFVEEHLAFRDRLFVTGGVRSDRNSAFGANFKTVFYPKVAVSWVASDESFFPKYSWLNQLRLRTAYGASGVQPGTIDAIPYYSASTTRNESGDQPSLVLSTLGNNDLKPERSTELELGVDGTFWNSRLSTEITYYNKTSKDALISRGIPPSVGTGATARLENLGEVSNKGWEALITAQIIQRDMFGWDVSFNGSTNENKIVSLGGLPPFGGSTQQQVEGYPINGWWVKPLTGYADANGDGIITLNEITYDTVAHYLGNPLPRYELSFSNGFDFWQRRLRLGAEIDYKGGFKTYNNTERIRCASRLNCSGLINPSSSLFEQARTVLVRESPIKSVAGFIEDGDFIRFRELNLTFTAPEQWANRYLHGRSIAVTLAARNLGVLWTKYTGVDPEAFGATGVGNASSEFQSFAPPSYYAIRLSLGF
ncbi:MAG: SusC/RagA family TonB-linked outer membrane protein [Gemmatimonadales bacterium]